MKKSYKLITGFIALTAMSFFISCEGPEGPAGADGEDGIDGNAVCLECHNDAKQDSVVSQYNQSTHATSNIMYTGETVYQYANRVDCAKCHNNEGFIETQHTGLDTVAAAIPIPTAISCNTCHDTHSTFDFENDGPDYALRTELPVTLMMDANLSLDMGGTSNLCANCHQPRRSGPTPDDNGNYTITSSHWGPHHGPQATLLAGLGGYEVDGSVDYPAAESSTHFTGAGCTSCHMADAADGNSTGGHTFTPNMNSCTACHSDATDFNIENVQTDIEDLIGGLADKLVAANIIDEDGELIIPDGGLELPVDQAGAYYNYATVVDDRSLGIHNPEYITALLQNSIEVFN